MGILDFKGKAQAEAWNRRLNELNAETDQVLGQVYSCIDEIKTESSGDFVEQLVTTAADMADAAAEMIQAMKSLENLINNIIGAFANWIGEAVQSVADGYSKMTNM